MFQLQTFLCAILSPVVFISSYLANEAFLFTIVGQNFASNKMITFLKASLSKILAS